VRIPQRHRALSRSDFSFGSQDRQAKPLLQCVGVDALVIAPLGDRASEQHDPFGREGDENVLHRLDGIALTSVTASVQSRVVEALDRLALDQPRPSDRLIGVGGPKAQERAVKRRRHDHDLRVIDRAAKRRMQTIGGNRSVATTSTFITSLHISLADGNRLASISAI
jgi:hypothetical protein